MENQSISQRTLNPSEYTKIGREETSKISRPWLLFSTLPYYSLLLVYAGFYISLKYYHNPFFVIWFIYGLIPLLDYYVKHDWLNPTKEQYKDLVEKDIFFKIPVYLIIILDWVLTFWVTYFLCNQPYNPFFLIATIFGAGTLGATNFLTAHELFHKSDKPGRLIGCLTMAKSLYMHFFIEHNYGHHKNVATPCDPATSRAGEHFYEYLPRTIIGSYKSAWSYEANRLTNIRGYKSIWIPQNRMIWFALNNIVFPLIVKKIFGWYGCLIFLAIALESVIYLEAINYIEHYGLLRKETSPGVYEKVNILHSWNAPHRVTNYLLFKLQRHSDHHENGYKPYQTLLTLEESPMLPSGYALCILMGFFPPVWFEVMDPILKAHREKKKLDEKAARAVDDTLRKFMWVCFGFFSTIMVMWNARKNF